MYCGRTLTKEWRKEGAGLDLESRALLLLFSISHSTVPNFVYETIPQTDGGLGDCCD